MAKTAAPAREGTWTEWIADRALRGLLAGVRVAAPERRAALGGAAMRRIVGPAAGLKPRALENLGLVRPPWPEAEASRIADGSLDGFGRTLVELYDRPAMDAALAPARRIGDGWDAVADAAARERPVVFVTAHFGNHEAPRHVLTKLGYRIGGLYRPLKNPYSNDHYVATMADLSGPVFPRGRAGTFGFVRHLQRGGFATILFDVHPPSGAWIDFLGRPALTALTAAELALRFDAALVPYFGIRRGATFDIAVEHPIPPSNPVEMMTEATRRLEARILADPDQFFWLHRRWRKRPGAAP